MSLQPELTQYDSLPAFERVASLLRDELIAGQLHAGQTLVEMDLAERFDASRNTVREALRQLLCEGLVTYQRNKGVTVRVMARTDIKDIYIIRRTLELQAINGGRYIKQEALARMLNAIETVEAAARDDDWATAATYSLRFHQAIVSILGSRRFDSFFASIMAQLRLLFASAPDEKFFQQPWVERDRTIYQFLQAGQRDNAEQLLSHYLDDSEQALLRLFANKE
ncbi:MAG: GntR family transcriptional regulator [Gammaproteobacteria bacterium]|uniref:DNA-binding GntR family transcriptional regulator n=1 Tax=Tolumonas osonensis TaxID=675874 RepID=A0A841GAN5_9GAMM|nr:GntR family transcriptional regulator [Tolumonas osonensis]MBB6054999.1 DNA-binding GntR family transcriptional regulator [Tolumonas osonensis]NCB60256.1 GntR family transcriptional regulator [Gammaproteobacteria bacterium]